MVSLRSDLPFVQVNMKKLGRYVLILEQGMQMGEEKDYFQIFFLWITMEVNKSRFAICIFSQSLWHFARI